MTMMTRKKLYQIIFKTDTKAGILFDEILLFFIFLSVIIVMLRSVTQIETKYVFSLRISEWIVTILFTIEYILRIRTSKKKKEYIFSFYGIIDLLSILPSYFGWFVDINHLLMLRSLRLLRLFRILDLGRYTNASRLLRKSLKASRARITVFLLSVFIIVLIVGTLMYIIEWPAAWFDNIPLAVYRCIVTVTTVGYGDITPITPFGQFLSAALMLLWYGIIAIPTGIVTAEMMGKKQKKGKKKKKTKNPKL